MFTHFPQWFWSAGERLTSWMLISGSDRVKQWRVTHFLNACAPILISDSDLLKHWKETHLLDMHPFSSVVLIHSSIDSQTGWIPILVCDSDPLKKLKQLTAWIGIHPLWSVVLIHSNTEEQLTNWMCVHPFLSVVLIHPNNERATYNLDTCSSIHVSDSDSFKHWRATHKLDGCYPFWSVLLIKKATHSLDRCLSIFVSGSDLLQVKH